MDRIHMQSRCALESVAALETALRSNTFDQARSGLGDDVDLTISSLHQLNY
jgi:hypothetical protein